LVSLANRRLPPVQRPGFYWVLIDNGMFGFMKDGGRPDLDKWYHRLLVFVRDVERLRKPEEIVVVLPDWLHDVDFVLRSVQHPLARRLCRDYVCAAVVHSNSRFLWAEGGPYKYVASILAGYDHVSVLAAPLKVNCLRYDRRGRRRIVDKRGLECQLNVIRQVCSEARRHGLACHGLGLVLEPRHVKRAVAAGLCSFDSTAWTRPNKSVLARYLGKGRVIRGEVSAKTVDEKSLFMWVKIRQLMDGGVELPLDVEPLAAP